MIDEVVHNSNKLRGIQLIMVTVADSIASIHFKQSFKLERFPNIIILRDTNFQFEKLFGTSLIPTFFVYKKELLLKKIIGETTLEYLINDNRNFKIF